MNNQINNFKFVLRTKELLVRSTSIVSYLILFLSGNRVGPDHATLTKAAGSGSALFAKKASL